MCKMRTKFQIILEKKKRKNIYLGFARMRVLIKQFCLCIYFMSWFCVIEIDHF